MLYKGCGNKFVYLQIVSYSLIVYRFASAPFRGTMYTIIGIRDNDSSTFLKLEGGSGINHKINLIDIKICFSNIVLFRK